MSEHPVIPIRLVPNILEKDLEKAIQELKNQGYIVTQKRKTVRTDGKTVYALQAKFNQPPTKPGRILVEG